MDGVLIDTEPVWRAAESDVFAGLGIALSESDVLSSTGQPIEELIPVWRQRSPSGGSLAGAALAGAALASASLTDAEVADLVIDQVIAHVKAEGRPCRA